jgi:hypothetical protein
MSFGFEQVIRVRRRLRTVQLGFYSAAFWFGAIATGVVLQAVGLEWLGWLLFSIWVAVSLPALFLQLLLIVDTAGLALKRKPVMFTTLHQMYRQGQPSYRRSGERTIPEWLLMITVRTSPLSGVSTWCLFQLFSTVDLKSAELGDDVWLSSIVRSRLGKFSLGVARNYWVPFERAVETPRSLWWLRYGRT